MRERDYLRREKLLKEAVELLVDVEEMGRVSLSKNQMVLTEAIRDWLKKAAGDE